VFEDQVEGKEGVDSVKERIGCSQSGTFWKGRACVRGKKKRFIIVLERNPL